ncbi:uracil-DNA glycosylase [Aquipuribacter hungaricus]|uniref:Uracil-DNA glycosylase n=1 Tax=Aquipuribacter hungaricus TaxID=545624 RepID=A0ABV7WF01_9MICO
MAPVAGLGPVHPSWLPVLEPHTALLADLAARLDAEEAAGVVPLPARADVLRAFVRPLGDVRVLLLGQDPYPTPGHAVGLSFSVAPGVRPLPRSLRNVLVEREADLGLPVPASGDLSPWADAGVLLLNRVLTVRPGEAGSHRGLGWERVTAAAVEALVARDAPLVALLWGRDARTLAPALGGVATVESVHPSPLSASRGFFGSRPFSRVDEALVAQGAAPVGWRLADDRPAPEPAGG